MVWNAKLCCESNSTTFGKVFELSNKNTPILLPSDVAPLISVSFLSSVIIISSEQLGE